MSELGQRLRTSREERGMSMAEAANTTRILPRYLQALERGDYQSLPGDVYARGFIRNYAQLLNLPAEEMIAQYRRERGEPSGTIRVVPAALPPRNRSCLLPSISFFGTFFVILVLGALAYFGAQSRGLFERRSTVVIQPTATSQRPTPTTWGTPTEQKATPQPTANPSPTPPPAAVTAAVAQLPPAVPTASAGPPSAPTGAPPATPTGVPGAVVVGVTIVPQAVQGSWMEVRVDGIPALNQLLRAGQSGQWTPQREIFINIGDTSAVVLTVNGQSCAGFPGPVRGVPRRVTITTSACP
ncbi:MAG: hypothetical protein NVS2B7_13910 [Herpetosiphon sp.]